MSGLLAPRTLALRYAAFALIAMGANLGTQFLTIRIYRGPAEFWIALAAGTGTGLIVKYLLDKRWIFYYTTKNLADDAGRFLLYSLAGVATTAVFWGTEFFFEQSFAWEGARFVGGALGLMFGYTAKYFLDKRFVFTGKEAD